MGALGDDLHGDRGDRVAPDGGDRRGGANASSGSLGACPWRDRADGTVGPGDVLWGLVLAVIATVGFERTTTRTSPTSPTRRGGAGYPRTGSPRARGSALGLAAALPFALRGSYGGAFLTAAALLGSSPCPPCCSCQPTARAASRRDRIRVGFRDTRENLLKIVRIPELRGFLLAYLFFEDGTDTVVYFSAVFASHTLGFTTAEVIGLYFVVQISALAGAWLWARPIDTWGPKNVVMTTL